MKDYSKNKWWKEEKPVLETLTYNAYPDLNYLFPKTKTSVTACIFLLCIAWGIGITLTLWVEFWDTYALAGVNVPHKVEYIDINKMPVIQQIEYYAEREHFDNAKLLIDLAQCESSLRPNVTGDNGQSRGLYQWHKGFNPQVSDKCAYDVECSTLETIKQIKLGNLNLWSCAKEI